MKCHREAATALFKGCPYVDVEARDIENETPLITAAKEGKTEFIRFLMEYRQDLAEPSQQLGMAASRAADNGHFETMQFFIQQQMRRD
jgi:ankyrin repeat protein